MLKLPEPTSLIDITIIIMSMTKLPQDHVLDSAAIP
jgi:hypothetical protein